MLASRPRASTICYDDDDCGGYDDDNMSDFSGNTSDGQYGA